MSAEFDDGGSGSGPLLGPPDGPVICSGVTVVEDPLPDDSLDDDGSGPLLGPPDGPVVCSGVTVVEEPVPDELSDDDESSLAPLVSLEPPEGLCRELPSEGESEPLLDPLDGPLVGSGDTVVEDPVLDGSSYEDGLSLPSSPPSKLLEDSADDPPDGLPVEGSGVTVVEDSSLDESSDESAEDPPEELPPDDPPPPLESSLLSAILHHSRNTDEHHREDCDDEDDSEDTASPDNERTEPFLAVPLTLLPALFGVLQIGA